MMLNRAELKKDCVNIFVYEIGLQEKSVDKRAKLDSLWPTEAEWERVKLFVDLLGVSLFPDLVILNWCSFYTYI